MRRGLRIATATAIAGFAGLLAISAGDGGDSSVAVVIDSISHDPACMNCPIAFSATAAFTADGDAMEQLQAGWTAQYRWKWELLGDGELTETAPAQAEGGWTRWDANTTSTATGSFPMYGAKLARTTVQVRLVKDDGAIAEVCEATATETITVLNLEDATNFRPIAYGDGTATMAWDPSPSPSVAGYKYHIKPDEGTLVDVGNVTQCTITGLTNGETYVIGLHTYDIYGNMTHTALSTVTLPAAEIKVAWQPQVESGNWVEVDSRAEIAGRTWIRVYFTLPNDLIAKNMTVTAECIDVMCACPGQTRNLGTTDYAYDTEWITYGDDSIWSGEHPEYFHNGWWRVTADYEKWDESQGNANGVKVGDGTVQADFYVRNLTILPVSLPYFTYDPSGLVPDSRDARFTFDSADVYCPSSTQGGVQMTADVFTDPRTANPWWWETHWTDGYPSPTPSSSPPETWTWEPAEYVSKGVYPYTLTPNALHDSSHNDWSTSVWLSLHLSDDTGSEAEANHANTEQGGGTFDIRYWMVDRDDLPASSGEVHVLAPDFSRAYTDPLPPDRLVATTDGTDHLHQVVIPDGTLGQVGTHYFVVMARESSGHRIRDKDHRQKDAIPVVLQCPWPPDIDTNSDNIGAITAADDAIEDAVPGRMAGVGGPRVEVVMRGSPMTANNTLTLDFATAGSHDVIRVWDAPTNGSVRSLPHDYTFSGSDIAVWVEAIGGGRGWLRLTANVLEGGVDQDGNSTMAQLVDTLAFTGVHLDLDVDSDNDNGVGDPERDADEDGIEDSVTEPGKFVMVNHDDGDRDGVPDYADMDNAEESQFVPLVLSLGPDIDWNTAIVTITYDGEPAFPTAAALAGNNLGNGYVNYDATARTGREPLRIWRDCEPADTRTAANYVVPGAPYTAAALGFADATNEITLYIEAINEVAQSTIQATVDIVPGISSIDTVTVTAVAPNLGVNCNNNLVNLDGLCVGIPDVDFVIDDSDDIIEDQRDGLQFWTARDDIGELTDLGATDLLPVVVDVPADLFAAGFRFFLSLDGWPMVDVYDSPCPGLEYLQDLGELNTLLERESYGMIDSTPAQLAVTAAGRHELLIKSTGGESVTVTLLVREPGTDNTVAADSVRLRFSPTRELYTMWSSRGEPNPDDTEDSYPLDGMNTQVMSLYPEAVHIYSGVRDPNKRHYLMHIHGYNITESKAYDEVDEMFRRTYWTGFRGQFLGFAWNGDETYIQKWVPLLGNKTPSFGQNVENSFQTAPRLRQFLANTVRGTWGVPLANVDLLAHSLGNQLMLEALRLHRYSDPGTVLVNSITCIQPAVWTETFHEAVPYVMTGPMAQTYTVADQMQRSWSFWFRQPGFEVRDAVNNMVHSFNASTGPDGMPRRDFAVVFMRIDDCLKRNPHSNQYQRIDLDRPLGIPQLWGNAVTQERVAVDSANNGQLDLARQTPVLLAPDRNTANVFPGIYPPFLNNCAPLRMDLVLFGWGIYQNQVVEPLAHVPNPVADVNLNAVTLGWPDSAHGSGFKGEGEGQGTVPLADTWQWFQALAASWSFVTGAE